MGQRSSLPARLVVGGLAALWLASAALLLLLAIVVLRYVGVPTWLLAASGALLLVGFVVAAVRVHRSARRARAVPIDPCRPR